MSAHLVGAQTSVARAVWSMNEEGNGSPMAEHYSEGFDHAEYQAVCIIEAITDLEVALEEYREVLPAGRLDKLKASKALRQRVVR